MTGTAITILSPDHVADLGPASAWQFAGTALAPRRLRLAAQDRRWQTRWVIASVGNTVVGVVPMYRVRSAAASDSIYDPRVVAPGISQSVPEDAREWLYVGGGLGDLIAGATVSLNLNEHDRRNVSRRLMSEAFAYGRREGLYPFALYLRDEEIGAFDGTGSAAQVRQTAVLDLPGRDFDAYVQQLRKRDRYRVRHELPELAELHMHAEPVEVAGIIPEAAPLIASTKERYGVRDHAVMVSFRLHQWATGGADDCRGFALRDPHGEVIGVSFAAVHRSTAELYELGLAADADHRLHAYVELLVYAPVRFALEHGCETLTLGMDSLEPKARRGARVEPVWAVTA